MANFFHMISSFNVNVSVMLITCWALTWTTSSSSSIQTKAFGPARQKLRKKFMSAFIQKPECLIISQFWNKTFSDSKDISIFYLPKNWPGGNHAYSRAFSAHFPRARRMRGECAENTRRIRGECAENTRQRNAYFPRIIRAFSAHLKIKKGPIFFIFQNFLKFQKFPKKLKFNFFKKKSKNFKNFKNIIISKNFKNSKIC